MRLILFKILLFIAVVYSAFAFTQPLSKAEHCISLEETLNINHQWHENYVDVYLNHLEKCQPPIKYQFSFYKKLMDQLLKADLSPPILESMDKIIQHLLDSIPVYSERQSLQSLAGESWQTLSEQKNNNVAFHVFSPASYNFEEPLFATQETNKIQKELVHITTISQKFSNSFSICRNTEDFQYLLKPLDSFLQNLIFISLQSAHYDQLRSFQKLYVLYHSLNSPEDGESSVPPQFISWMQIPPSFIEFLSNSVDWNSPPFQNNYEWLKPVLSSLKIRFRVNEKMHTYCLPYQPFLNKEFIEHHYTVKFAEGYQVDKHKRREILETIQENIKTQDSMFFFRSHTPSEHEHIYLYFITHHLPQK